MIEITFHGHPIRIAQTDFWRKVRDTDVDDLIQILEDMLDEGCDEDSLDMAIAAERIA